MLKIRLSIRITTLWKTVYNVLVTCVYDSLLTITFVQVVRELDQQNIQLVLVDL